MRLFRRGEKKTLEEVVIEAPSVQRILNCFRKFCLSVNAPWFRADLRSFHDIEALAYLQRKGIMSVHDGFVETTVPLACESCVNYYRSDVKEKLPSGYEQIMKDVSMCKATKLPLPNIRDWKTAARCPHFMPKQLREVLG